MKYYLSWQDLPHLWKAIMRGKGVQFLPFYNLFLVKCDFNGDLNHKEKGKNTKYFGYPGKRLEFYLAHYC
jgi:hypothetical protein